MKTELSNVLDAATGRLLAGEPVGTILADYPGQAEELSPLLNVAAMLEPLQPLELPAPELLRADRNEFLAEVARLQPQAVSPGFLSRLKEWIVPGFPWPLPDFTFQRKEQWRMSTLLVKAIIVFGLVFGSMGGTAVMAAHSLPGSPVYPLKLSMEQARLVLANGPAEEAGQHLNLARVRTQEMVQVALRGELPAEATQTRLQQHLQQAIRLAAETPDREMQGLLTRARSMLQDQEQTLAQVQPQVDEPARQALGQTQQLLNRARQAVDTGLADPQTFRLQYRHGLPVEELPPADQPGPGEPGGNPDCPSGDCEPVGDQHQHRYGPDQEPPGQNGEPCQSGDCEPVGDQHQSRHGPEQDPPGQNGEPCQSGDCEPVGDAHRYGRDSDSLPGPHGDCDSGDCEPVGDQHHYGAEPDYGPGTDMPVRDRDCPPGDCEPVGDAHKHGQTAEEPGGPHGDQDQDCTNDCEPVGDQNQNGPGSANQNSAGEPGGNPDGHGNHHGSPATDNGGDSDNSGDSGGGSSDGGSDSGGGDNGGSSGGGDDNGGSSGGGGGGNGNGAGDGGDGRK